MLPIGRRQFRLPLAEGSSIVDIAPPRWLAGLARGSAVVAALAGAVAGADLLRRGATGSGLTTVACGALFAVMTWDVAQRRAVAGGDTLVLHQWYRTRTIGRSEIASFEPARASFFRWDIVAVRNEGAQARLWVTRMLPAGRRTRMSWLDDLESWRTGRPA